MEVASKKIVCQRIRNRIIEVLELVSSFDDVAKIGAFEAINLCYDYLPFQNFRSFDVYSNTEILLLDKFATQLHETSNLTTYDIQDKKVLEKSEEWTKLRLVSIKTVKLMNELGKFSEDVESLRLN
jgi:hypothetical protein